MSENPLQLSGTENFHEILVAKAALAVDHAHPEELDKALEALKEERGLPKDSKDKALGTSGPASKALAAHVKQFLSSHKTEEKKARAALNTMISRATVRNKLSELVGSDEKQDES